MTMEGVREGKTLVLGDGDFSFSVALAHRMVEPSHLTATARGMNEETLKQHSAAGDNIHSLQHKGVTVLFDVDATALSACVELHGQSFDHIIFNFPHVGRKAPIKRNRELLRNFFTSCTQYMSADGQVYVTLCQGQGGTPADQPQRAWHNSWQVVAMAAEAGLILREVVPFCADDWELYRPSGYRSRDKAFHTEGALTHVFAQSCPLAPMTQTAPTLVVRVEGQDRHFSKPVGIRYKIGRNLHQVKDHPVALVTKQLCMRLEDTVGVRYLQDEDYSLVCGSADIQTAGALSDGQVKMRPIQVKEKEFVEETKGDDSSAICWYLRPSLTTHLPIILQSTLQPGLVHVLTGEVFSHCAISTYTYPLQHQLLGVLLLPKNTGDSDTNSKSATMDESKTQATSKKPKKDDHSSEVLGPDSSTKHTAEDAKSCHIIDIRSCVDCLQQIVSSILQVDTHTAYVDSEYLLLADQSTNTDVAVGQVFLVNQDILHGCRVPGYSVLCFTLSLDRLALLKFKIPDIRLLWTEDKHFYEQFRVQLDSAMYKEFSKFPPSYSYDISFWENAETDFNEDDFMMLVREASHDVVTEATVVDRYSQPGTGRKSRCYRLSFQAPDRALGARHVKDIMVELTRRLGEDMGLQVR